MDSKVIIGVVIVIVVIAGFFFFGDGSSNVTNVNGNNVEGLIEGVVQPTEWIDMELKDVNTQETFKISDFQGKTVLLESFAVWCPTCTRQQQITKKLDAELGDSLVSVSIDTDPNEDEQFVLDYIQSNGFNWRYAISPVEMTQSLIAQFGPGIVSAPSVPMILICENGKARKLGGGLKLIDELKFEIARGC